MSDLIFFSYTNKNIDFVIIGEGRKKTDFGE